MRTTTLTFAIAAAIGLAGPAFAQSTPYTPQTTPPATPPTTSGQTGTDTSQQAMPMQDTTGQATTGQDTSTQAATQSSATMSTQGQTPPASGQQDTQAADMAAGNAAATGNAATTGTTADTTATTGTTADASGSATAASVTSSPGNSIVGDYHIDFDAMDGNHDGNLSRKEAGSNATLMREFRAVDHNRNGKLSKDELKGWM
ncbi:MAG TPA: hypothetical protein VLM17_11605 [Xanthomonadaceae bacterium]|nr:hypothetical protein [Xanthomonadaceae bacterium]